MEQLIYDCRLMNRARADGKASARTLQRWLVESDVATDPQAFIISPESAVELARAIVTSDSHYHAGVAVARKAVALLKDAYANGRLHVAENEVDWFDTLNDTLDDLPENEDEFISQQLAVADLEKFIPAEYGLA
jgi:methanol--5-hydroxybenzimidazolylcobamide Co-methyltransferase